MTQFSLAAKMVRLVLRMSFSRSDLNFRDFSQHTFTTEVSQATMCGKDTPQTLQPVVLKSDVRFLESERVRRILLHYDKLERDLKGIPFHALAYREHRN